MPPTITAVPTTVPPVTVQLTGTPTPQLPKGCIIGDKSTGVCHAGNYGDIQKPEALNILKLFEKESKDDGKSDKLFYDAIRNLFDKDKSHILDLPYYQLQLPQRKAKIDDKALDIIGLNETTKKEFLAYRDKTANNDTGFIIVLGEDYGAIFFEPDRLDFNLTTYVDDAVLNVTQCYKLSKGKCEPIPFKVGEGAWFYITPREDAVKLIYYLF